MSKQCVNTKKLFHSKLLLEELPELIERNGGLKTALNKRKSGHIPLSSAIVYGATLDVIKFLFENNKEASTQWRSPTGSKYSYFIDIVLLHSNIFFQVLFCI